MTASNHAYPRFSDPSTARLLTLRNRIAAEIEAALPALRCRKCGQVISDSDDAISQHVRECWPRSGSNEV